MTRAPLGLVTLALAACSFPDAPAPRPEEVPSAIAAPLRASNAEAAKLYRVVETWFNDYLALNPILASELGDHRFDDRFGDYASASWMADSLGIEQEALERLAAVDPKQLEGEDLLSYEAFKQQRESNVYGFRYPSELLAIDQVVNQAGVLAQLASGEGAHPFRTTADYDHFLARMDDFVAWTEQAINNLRAGVSKGVVLPKVVVERTLPQLAEFARIEDPKQSIFWRPLFNFPPAPSVEDRRRLLREYDEKLRTRVLPAYRRLHDYLAHEYLPQARDSVGWSALPGGDYWYAWLVRHYTTLTLTPDQVHELGLREVARLRANLSALPPIVGEGGDLRATLDAMRAETRYRATDPAALLADYEVLRQRADATLPTQFRRQPKANFVIRAVEPFRATSAASAFAVPPAADGSRPAVLYVNTHNLPARPTYLTTTMFLREAVPGRLYQAALAQEAANLPNFRRFGTDTAFVDGWASYAETLGRELGLYDDAASQFGAVSTALLRAARLVIDTGIHAKGWSRAHAIDYLRANTVLGETDIAAEVDRCIARPGQAIAQEVGEQKLLELRRRAQQQLGAQFDLREFHEQVVGGGALPLPVLEAKVDRWLEQQRR